MSSENDNIAIRVQNLGKCYQVYPTPSVRLKQAVASRASRMLGREPRKFGSEFWALRNIDFEVPKGEAFGVIGRNGSGKSTLLQLITGVLNPTEGSVETKGRIAALLELGSGFNPEFTGRENVYLNGMLLGLSRAEVDRRFDGIAAFADIGEHLDRPIKTYSSGMLVRLAFAVQVQIDPDILIIDEALAVGDALFQKRCFARINRLVDDGVTILFVSHDQETVRTVTRRALLLHEGGAVALGTSSETLLAYRRLINREESKYFASLAQLNLATDQLAPVVGETAAEDGEVHSALDGAADVGAIAAVADGDVDQAIVPRVHDEGVSGASSQEATLMPAEQDGGAVDKSFGAGHAQITKVSIFDSEGEPCAVFYPGETIKIRIDCRSRAALKNLNVSLRIRNREGLKVYSWGTLNQDMRVYSGTAKGPTFWDRHIAAGEDFAVWFEFVCPLGPGFYEIQGGISHEGSPDYSEQTILHWKDEAAFFQVFMDQKAYYFGGSFDLKMHSTW